MGPSHTLLQSRARAIGCVAIKAIAPKVKVFCVFAREVVPEHREADLRVIGMFDGSKLDLLAFTSYPFALQEVSSPVQLPDDYYTRALAIVRGKKPALALTELGWPSLAVFGGEAGQAEFLGAVAGRLTAGARDTGQGGAAVGGAGGSGPGLELLGWAWLHDLASEDHTGLIELDGTPKMAFEVWRKLSGR